MPTSLGAGTADGLRMPYTSNVPSLYVGAVSNGTCKEAQCLVKYRHAAAESWLHVSGFAYCGCVWPFNRHRLNVQEALTGAAAHGKDEAMGAVKRCIPSGWTFRGYPHQYR